MKRYISDPSVVLCVDGGDGGCGGSDGGGDDGGGDDGGDGGGGDGGGDGGGGSGQWWAWQYEPGAAQPGSRWTSAYTLCLWSVGPRWWTSVDIREHGGQKCLSVEFIG